MNLVLQHLEFLLRRHDCVTVPGIGALIVRYRHARFDRRCPGVLLPPSREVAFNGDLTDSDGVLERSVARQCGVSFEVASQMVAEESASLRRQLDYFGSLSLGRIGMLQTDSEGITEFTPEDTRRWDLRFFGLRPLYLSGVAAAKDTAAASDSLSVVADGDSSATSSVAAITAPVRPWQDDAAEDNGGEDAGRRSRRRRVVRAVVGVAASLAVVVSLALFFFHPIVVDNAPVQASMAPTQTSSSTASTVADVSQSEEVLPEQIHTEDTEAEDFVAEDAAAVNEAAVTAQSVETAARPAGDVAARPAEVPAEIRFRESDGFCVIVASFPDEAQARRYIAEHPGTRLGVLHQDGKYRIYAATASDYSGALAQKGQLGVEGAWICRR